MGASSSICVDDETNYKITIKYPNGSIYTGDWLNQKRIGFGKLVFENGDVYEGEFDGNPSGKGKMTYRNGDVYEGGWKKFEDEKKSSIRFGHGIMIYKDGDFYEGEWDDAYCRTVKIKYSDGNVFEGELKNGRFDGKGKIILCDKGVYEGEFKNGKIEGKGKMVYSDGNFYEGNWKENKYDGKGILKKRNGDFLDGIWNNNKCTGKCILFGSVYEGDIVNGIREGSGKTMLMHGEYDGHWLNDKLHGYGKMNYRNGDVYEGNWKDDNRFGFGKMIYQNGDVYEGDWKNGKRHGIGKMIYRKKNEFPYDSSDREFNGEWFDDIRIFGELSLYYGTMISPISFVNNLSFGYTKIIYQDERTYYGEILNNVPDGIGRMIYPNGKTQSGQWEKGVFTSSNYISPQCGVCSIYLDFTEFKVSCHNCFNKVCISCHKNHYIEIKNGDVFPLSKLCCPFCRKMSHSYFDFNELSESKDVDSFGNYGKCKYCLHYRKLEETCSTENELSQYPNGYVCHKCVIPDQIKKCPRCKVYIEKSIGCNHVTCKNDGKKNYGCNFEFCWICFIDWDKVTNHQFHYDGKCVSA